MDNQAVSKVAHQAPHWMPSRQQIAQPKDEKQCLDKKMNNIAHKLATKGACLPVREGQPKEA